MANFRKRPSGSWTATVYIGMVDGEKKYAYITKASKQECKAAAAILEAELEQGEYVASTSITLGEAMDKYNKSVASVLSPTTLQSYKMYARHSFAVLRNQLIKKITSDDIQLHYATARGHLSPKSIANENAYLSVILTKYLGRKNPCKDVILPKKVKYLYKTLSDDQIAILLQKLKGEAMEVPILLAVWCGLRRSEIIGLRWEDVDFDKQCLYIRQARVLAEREWLVKSPKSYSGTRTVHLPLYIANMLKELVPLSDSDLVINKNGSQVYKFFKRFLAKNGLPDVRLHDLRHTCATAMLSLGVPDLYASGELGHLDPNMTKKYQHIRQEEQTRARLAIDEFFMSKFKKKF